MACCRTEPPDAGYATAAAMAFGLSLALTAAALTTLASTRLHAARADLDRLAAERFLDGARQQAVQRILTSSKPIRLGWADKTQDAEVSLLAEPEAAKLGYEAAAKLEDADFKALGVNDADALRSRLAEAASGADAPVVSPADLDSSPVWRACAGSLMSFFGTAKSQTLTAPESPDDRAFTWRLGEVWRIRTVGGGWAETTLVRFTGDAGRPAAVIARALARQTGGDRSCDAKLAGA